ncbi:esterase family protein [Mucilaginibacter sp. AK015]|uniref:alpha/beta hydrolase n=1 Tax=Mucilaginibacter sp. AK015 TaxID=2723072 RepID=UPI00161B16CE|nr:alpha/beta hydrolase-fold protein [Mucilaginibacter sp. AK015]MBB5397789.1 enterochelin esterase-like enzyme [Mucilaginibacter sp. AK015]
MKKIALLLLMLCPAVLFAQTGKVYDNLTLTSKILKSERKYAVYLPPDYETSGRNYPVLYLLHGAGDDQTGWVQFGEVLNITDKAIRDGVATPMIIIMPDANTGRRGYNNDIKGDWNYEDFFFSELVPFVEKKYRIKGEKRFRAIAGLSMGGGGSFVYALHHPEMFSSACPLSAATGFLSLEDAKAGISKNNPGMADSAISNYYNRYSVLPLINAIPDDQKKAIRWFMDVGDDDFLYEGNGLVHNLMRKKEIPHEYRVRDGAHNWTYWRASLPVVLEFVSQAFHQY